MIRRVPLHEENPGWMIASSLIIHLLLFFICTNSVLLRPKIQETTPYYVDLISLPTSDPSPAVPAAAPIPQTVTTAPQAVIQQSKPAMALPAKAPVSPTQPPTATSLNGKVQEQEARNFAERLNKIEHASEARHQAAAIESLKRKATASSQTGSLSGTGLNTGSDYGAYIQSRLKDSLATTIVYRTRLPETGVHLYIDRKGKLLRAVMISPSKDKLFNDSVMRAIEKAKQSFPSPPNNTDFDKLYVFSPQEVLGK